MGKPMTRILTSLALLVACGLGAQETASLQHRRDLPARKGPRAISGHDRADLRRDWNLWWFGGKLSPEYLDYKNQLAAQEQVRWAHLMPGAPKAPLSARALPAAAAAINTWVNLGPTANKTTAALPDIDSGRPVAIVAHPTANTLYLATSGGGVYRCDNADPALAGDWIWTSITDALPTSGSAGNVSLGALAMSPSSATTLYLGAGDAHDSEGRGFFTTTNGGTSWTVATGLGNATRSYAILPLTATRIFWGTNDGLKVSNDGGATFAPVVGGPATGLAWTVQKLSATELVCSVESAGAGAIYYSSDSGATWQTTTLPTATAVRITLVTSAASASAVWGIYEDSASGNVARGLLKSTDKGHTWTWVAAPVVSGGLFQGTGGSMSTDGGQGFYNHGISVDPTNANQVYVGSNLALYRTSDGGNTWSQMTHWYGSGHVYAHADFHAASWSADGSTLYIANDGGLAVVRSPRIATIPTGAQGVGGTPSVLTFIDNRRNKGLASHLAYSLGSTNASTPVGSKYLVSLGLQDNGTRVRQPATAGAALTGTEGVFEDQIGGDGFGTLIHPTNGNLILGSLYYTDIYKGTDAGVSAFVSSSTGITEAGSAAAAPFSPFFAQGNTANTVYTFVNTKVYKSTNFGDSWAALGGALPQGTGSAIIIRNIGASPTNANAVGVVTNGGRVFLTYNGGTTWAQSGAVPNNGLSMSSICFDPTNANTVYVASVGPGLTYNGGTTWTQAAAVPNNGLSMSSICFDPTNANTVYVASVGPGLTYTHLWKSTNGGTSWAATDTGGLPPGIPVHVVRLDPTDANHVFAGTDFGVYDSTNGGTTWARYGSGLPLVATRDLYIAPDGSFLRAATFGRGVWELQTTANTTNPTVALAPTAVTMVNGGTQSFTPTVGNGTLNTVTWASAAGGLVPSGTTANGVPQTYTAPASGTSDTVTVSTVDTPVATAQAAVTLVAPANVNVTVSPATVEMVVGTGTQQFTASVAPALTNSTVTWSGTGVSASGLFSATGQPAGPYTVTATSQAAPGRSGTATVSLVSAASVTVAVTPTPVTLIIGASQTFTATVTGLSVAANKAVTWSTNGGGTFVGNVFTATTAGSFAVTATNTFSGATGAATVNVRTLDLNGDAVVDLRDLLTFAKNYGSTITPTCDLNGDATVNDADLTILLSGL